jgi:flavin reductase (DIM6/NTAB) family NADH-FMN oxidoreductase RutF
MKKRDFPVQEVRRYLEPGPIVLVSSRWRGRSNIMTLGWHTVLEFTPSLIGLMISSGNYSHDMIRRSKECVINLPTPARPPRDILSGFLSADEKESYGRPVGVTLGHDRRSLLMADDVGNVIWRVTAQ